MTMTITIPDEISAEFDKLPEKKRNRISQAASNAVTWAVQSESANKGDGTLSKIDGMSPEEWDAMIDEMLDELPPVPPLSDYAVSREGIYEDHP